MKRYLSLILAIAATISAQIVPSTGNVRGPTSATDNAVARYDGTTGKLIQNSGVTIDDSGNLTVSGSTISLPSTSGNVDLFGRLFALNVSNETRLYAGSSGISLYDHIGSGRLAQFTQSLLTLDKNTTIGGNLTVGSATTPKGKIDAQAAYDGSAPSTSSTPIIRANNGGAISLWVGGNAYSNMWMQAIQDDGSNNIKNINFQPLGGDVYFGGNATFAGQVNSGTSTSSGYNNNRNVQLEAASGRVIVNHENGVASGTIYAGFGYNGSGIGSITQDGTSGVLYNTTSDERLKENVRDVTNSGVLIDALKPRVFDWKNNGDKDRFGFLAQEVHAVFPQAVKKGDDGEEVTDAWAMDAAKLVPVLVAELKALRARVAALEAARN